MDTKILMQKDLFDCIRNFSLRCLNKSVKWASDLLIAISKNQNIPMEGFDHHKGLSVYQYSKLMMATSLFNLGEYKRAAFYIRDIGNDLGNFLHIYFQYKELQKLEWEEFSREIESSLIPCPCISHGYQMLLESIVPVKKNDGYIYYLQYDNLIKQLPKIWMKDFYILEVEKKLGVSKLNKQNWDNFSSIGFSDTLYIKSSMAIKHKSLNLIDRAKNIYEEIFELDPYSVEHVDTFSNILYLHQDITRLSKLVRETVAYARYKPETCYAIELDPLEYRAWFGLGHVYELLKMPNECLSLYKKAYYIRPCDSKLSLAIARILESLGNMSECIDMLGVSVESGDFEGTSTIKLACLLENKDKDRSASLYKRFLSFYDDKGIAQAEDSATATLFLMDYYFEKKQYEETEIYARRGCRYNQSLKHSEITLQKLDKIISEGKGKRKNAPIIPIREQLFVPKDQDES
ncbi:hypothetical protein HZS_415, partial [Henneguya salminicola]